MRYLIGGLAALVVVIAAALLVVPRLFDERLLAGRLQQAVSDATGEVLVIEGGLDLSLLPRPLLSMHRLRLDDAARGLALTADRLDLELEVGPLLAGELGVTDALLVRPVLRFSGDPATALGQIAARLGAIGQDDLASHLGIADGSLLVTGADSDAAPLVWRGIDAALSRDEITGTRQFHAEGIFSSATSGPRLVLDGEVGSAPPQRPRPLRFDLALEGEGSAALGFRGRIEPGDAGDAQLDGRLTLDAPDPPALRGWLAGLAPSLAAWPVPRAPLTLEAGATLDLATSAAPMRLDADNLVLTIAGQTLEGALGFTGGMVPTLDLQLRAGRLTLPDDWPATADPRHLMAVAPVSLGGRLGLEVDELDWRGRSFRQIAVDLGLDGDGEVRVERAVAVLPGPGDVDFTGRLGPLGSATGHWLSGHLQVALQEPGELAALLGEPPALLGQSTTLAIDTDLDWSSAALTLRDADLSLDATRAAGSIAWRPAVAGGRAQLALKLTLDRLDLGTVVDANDPEAAVVALGAALPDTDLGVDLRIERASMNELRLGALTLRLDSVGGEVDIGRASLDGVAGSALMLKGHVTPASRAFDLDLAFDIASLTRLLRLADYPAPPALTLLGPVNLRAHLEGDPASTAIDATLEGDSFEASARGALDDWTTPGRGGELAFTLAATDAAALLRQVGGVPITAPIFTGPLEAALRLTLAEGRPTGWSLQSTLGGLDLDLARAPGGGGAASRLDLRLGPLSPAAAAVLYELATPPLGLVPGPPWRWLGYWPDQSLRFDWLAGEPCLVRIELVPEADPEAPVVIEAKLENGVLAVPSFAWADGPMRLAGSLALEQRHAGAAAALSLDLALTGVPAARLGELFDLPKGLEGDLDLDASLTSLGHGVRSLIGNLAGEANIALADGRIGAVAVDRLDGGLVLERGVLRPAGDAIPFTGPQGDGRVSGSVDLLAWLADLEIRVRPVSPGAPTEAQRLLGGLAAPAPSD